MNEIDELFDMGININDNYLNIINNLVLVNLLNAAWLHHYLLKICIIISTTFIYKICSKKG